LYKFYNFPTINGLVHKLPQTYTVTENGERPAVVLGAPVMRSLDADVGDTILVTETDGGIEIEVI